MKRLLLLALALLPAFAFAGDVLPSRGGQTLQVSAYGPAAFDLPLQPLPPGTESATLRLRLSLDERMLVAHAPYPDGLGSIVWATTGPDGWPQSLEATVSIPDTDAFELYALCRSSVATSWPLEAGGMGAIVPTQGALFEYVVPAWNEKVTVKIRLPAAWTALTVEPTDASVGFSALQTLDLEVIPN